MQKEEDLGDDPCVRHQGDHETITAIEFVCLQSVRQDHANHLIMFIRARESYVASFICSLVGINDYWTGMYLINFFFIAVNLTQDNMSDPEGRASSPSFI